jgi:hypothetical protein
VEILNGGGISWRSAAIFMVAHGGKFEISLLIPSPLHNVPHITKSTGLFSNFSIINQQDIR